MIDSDIRFIQSLRKAVPASQLQLRYMIRNLSTLPNDTAIDNAIKLLGILYENDFPPQRIFPAGGLGGGVGFMYYNDKEEPALFEMENEGKIWAGYLTESTSSVFKIDLDNNEELQNVINTLKTFVS